MYWLGFWQFVPFLVTVVGLVLTDMLTGIALGMLVGVFQILMYNYRLDPYTEVLGDGRIQLRLTEHMTFLNKASLKRVLRELPAVSRVTIDATTTRIIDHDVREVLMDFAAYAPSVGIELELIGMWTDT